MSDAVHIQHLGDLRALNDAIGTFAGETLEIEERVRIIFSALMNEIEERLAVAKNELESMEEEVHYVRQALNDCESYRDEDDDLD